MALIRITVPKGIIIRKTKVKINRIIEEYCEEAIHDFCTSEMTGTGTIGDGPYMGGILYEKKFIYTQWADTWHGIGISCKGDDNTCCGTGTEDTGTGTQVGTGSYWC